ncbi:MAG: hypothetical protein J6Q73_00095 [Bacteroidaceae bacterium]|nr:hypothetical protein [Bacteroidaceae bacterium]
MPTGIRRSLFIGLGGTGMSALLHTKKIFVDTYGEVPPMIGFLGIDTDGNVYNKSLTLNNGGKIKLTNNEQMPIQVRDARPIYMGQPDDFAWVARESVFALGSLMIGAGQVRTNGRFALTLNFQAVQAKIQQMLLQITNAQNINNNNYYSLGNNVEIHLVFSVSGGTGSGTFVNIASHIRQAFPQYKLRGYAVLPRIFDAMIQAPAAKANIYPNAYGAIKEIDYSMHMDFNSTPITLNYINGVQSQINGPLFNSVVLIDNVNQNNDSYTHINELTEMIGLALLTSTGELSSAAASVGDNLEKQYAAGCMDIRNKKAWIGGLGICEIQYKGTDLSKIYQLKASKNIIERLGNSCEDTDSIVNTWIDSPEVNIRENDGNDHVIDYIMEPRPKYELIITDKEEPENDVNNNKAQNKPKDDDVNNQVIALTEKVRTELTKLIVKYINKECGVSTVKNIILGITAQVDIFKSEMQSELEELRDKKGRLNTELDVAIVELKEYMKKKWPFRKDTEVEARCSDVVTATEMVNVNEIEIVRRQAALRVFNAISTMLLNENDKINNIDETLKNVNAQLTTELANITNNIGRDVHTFQIDLASEEAKNIKVVPTQIQIDAFARSIGGDAIYSLYGQDAVIVKNKLMAYTQQLPYSQDLANTTIDDIINNMDANKLDAIINKAIQKSSPLLDINYGEHLPKMSYQDFYYVGVPNMANNRLFNNKVIENITQGVVSIDYSSTGVNDKIIIYRQLGVIPAYALTCLSRCKNEYDKSSINHSIDAQWETRMIREDFDVQPQRPSANEDLLDFWTKGFIFGLIKNENGEYRLKSLELGDPLFDNWISLGNYRDDAYTQFKLHRKVVIREFTEYFDNYVKTQGEEALNQLISNVKAGYFDNYSQINMTKVEITARGNENIRRLITQELEYVRNL